MRYQIRAVGPSIFFQGLRAAIKLLPNNSTEQINRYLVPPGNPGAGILYGRNNIAKTITYRATYVPGGFNRERNAMRLQLSAQAAEYFASDGEAAK